MEVAVNMEAFEAASYAAFVGEAFSYFENVAHVLVVNNADPG